MDTNKIKLKVRKEKVACKKCGEIKEFYYLSDFSYGEKLIPIKDGKGYVYINLFEDKIFEELKEITKMVLEKHNVTLNKLMFAKCLNKLLGLTCDMVENESADTINGDKKCKYCGYNKFSSREDLKVAFVDIEVPVVTHFDWNALNENDKLEVVKNELRNLSYIN